MWIKVRSEGEKMRENIKPFPNKIWLSSPTMHGPELEYIKAAYETNWMSTVGENMQWPYQQGRRPFIWR